MRPYHEKSVESKTRSSGSTPVSYVFERGLPCPPLGTYHGREDHVEYAHETLTWMEVDLKFLISVNLGVSLPVGFPSR